MIDGINVMMTTESIRELRRQIGRKESHSTSGVPDHLAVLAAEARALANDINRAIGNPIERYENASKGG